MPLTETMKMGRHRDMTFLAELREHSSKDGISYWSICWPRKSNDYENGSLNNRGRIVLVHEMLCFMPVPPWIVDGHVRWGCRNSHEDWREEPGDSSKNNSLTWAKRNNSHDFHVATWNLFRKYFITLLTFQLWIVWQIAWRSHQRKTIWSQQWTQWGFWKLTFIQTSGHSWRTRHSCPHGVQHSCTQGRELFSS